MFVSTVGAYGGGRWIDDVLRDNPGEKYRGEI